jgi:hypothetical protein
MHSSDEYVLWLLTKCSPKAIDARDDVRPRVSPRFHWRRFSIQCTGLRLLREQHGVCAFKRAAFAQRTALLDALVTLSPAAAAYRSYANLFAFVRASMVV